MHEIIQGRALITPDELISLKNEVIIFTADTKPLKLPLTSPIAYEQALAYDPPERERHNVSDFILRRGDIARAQAANANEPAQEHREHSDNPSRNSTRYQRSNGQQSKTNRNNESKERTNNRKPGETRGRSGGTPPDYGD